MFLVHYIRRSANLASVEQIRRRRRAKLNGIAFLVCWGWHDELIKQVLLFVCKFSVM